MYIIFLIELPLLASELFVSAATLFIVLLRVKILTDSDIIIFCRGVSTYLTVLKVQYASTFLRLLVAAPGSLHIPSGRYLLLTVLCVQYGMLPNS